MKPWKKINGISSTTLVTTDDDSYVRGILFRSPKLNSLEMVSLMQLSILSFSFLQAPPQKVFPEFSDTLRSPSCEGNKIANQTELTDEGFGTCGQSYKHFTLVNYDSRVVIWGIFQSGTTLES